MHTNTKIPRMVLGKEPDPLAQGPLYRLVEILREETWVVIPMKELNLGQIFRVFEPDGHRTRIKDADGYTVFQARTNPEISPPGFWVVGYRGVSREE